MMIFFLKLRYLKSMCTEIYCNIIRYQCIFHYDFLFFFMKFNFNNSDLLFAFLQYKNISGSLYIYKKNMYSYEYCVSIVYLLCKFFLSSVFYFEFLNLEKKMKHENANDFLLHLFKLVICVNLLKKKIKNDK